MADSRGDAPAHSGEHYFGKPYTFQEIFQQEIDVLNERRGSMQPQIRLESEGDDLNEQKMLRPNEDADVVGLALSGGGIRSAAFCLGVLQALDRAEVLDSVDYMSTVSGGGYIGCSLTAALEASGEQAKREFPFASKLEEDEPPALQQIRNYSNYLFPRGGQLNLLRNAVVYARGLAVNVLLLAPFVFAASALTLLYYGVRGTHAWQHFFLTLWLAVAVIAAGIVWAIARSLQLRRQKPEYAGLGAILISALIALLVIVAFCELQPVILDAMLAKSTSNVAQVAKDWINIVWAVLAPVGAAMAYLANKLGEYVKSTLQSPHWSGPIKAAVLKIVIVIAGLILPIGIWVVYLDVTYWGICINDPKQACLAPFWLAGRAYALLPWPGYTATALYALVAVISFLLSLPLQPNANSLHALYRDRLRKAFLFAPQPRFTGDDLPLFTKRLSKITGLCGPYHLINAALNVQNSRTANRRGRNADFFVFTPKFVGSRTTGYVYTCEMEDVVPSLGLATAMATSGAAVSSNMGSQSIKALTASLALLNIRLGYWLRNPLKLGEAKPSEMRRGFSEFMRHRNLLANYYFILEMFGLLNEKRKSIYLTDGGHIENLGIYELLRRRCAVIIAVDAEADPQMAFGSFNMMERYALIDLGVRIDLPWQPIANKSLATGAAIDKVGDVPQKATEGATVGEARDVAKDHGPHCAVGEIIYPGGRRGVLIYIKASLTGDENDYVFDYKKRYSAFPHETTLDQLFTEEQFEAYRALGFHAAFNFFDRDDGFAHLDAGENPYVPGEIGVLDRLFPHQKPERTFAARLAAEKAAAAPKQAAKRPRRTRASSSGAADNSSGPAAR